MTPSRFGVRALTLAAVFVGGAVLQTGCSDEAPDTSNRVKIGLLLPFTGSLATWGRSAMNAAVLATDEINQAGGILSGDKQKDILLVVEDTATDANQAVKKAQDLIQEEVVGFVGPVEAGAALAVFEQVADFEDQAMIIIGTGPPAGRTDQDLMWRIMPADEQQGKEAAEYAYAELQKTDAAQKEFTVGIIRVETKNGEDLIKGFKEEMATHDGTDGKPKVTIVAEVKYPNQADYSTFNFSKQVNELTKDKPDLLYIASNSEDGAKMSFALADAVRGDYNPTLFGAGFLFSEFFVQNASSAIKGMIGTVPAPNADDQIYNDFLRAYKDLVGLDAQPYAEAAYDAVYLYALAMENAKDTTRGVFLDRENLLDTSDAPGQLVRPGVGGFKKAKELLSAGTDIDYQGAAGGINWKRGGFVKNGNYRIWRIKESGGSLEFEVFDNREFKDES